MREFLFKPFNQMTPEDYKFIGFKSGLEIHQQILTDKKLFCRCPAGVYSTNYDAEILRHMRPTLSELGVYDGTALMEFKTRKNITYRINRETVCTYEMDDTPPFLINEDALKKAIKIGLMFNSNIVDEIHIARKQYLDGSIPTGFQRTAIFALDGKIPYQNREIDIVQMSIEEDSCREVTDIGHDRVYLTDRLGMPLIETVTAPQMKTPAEVADVAHICAKVVRSSQSVRRGMGAAREDVNVSVEGGTRIEIKGVSQISKIPLLTYNEAMRQWNLLRLREELKRRGITPETFRAKVYDVNRDVKDVHYKPIRDAFQSDNIVKAVVLKGFADLLQWQTQTDTYFSKEISDRIRVIACLNTIPNLVHSDSKGDNLTSSEWQKIKTTTNTTSKDAVILVWGNEQDTITATNEIIIRVKEATIGVPSETRQALRDGTNGFERILPGADRMYPDTDLPPVTINDDLLDELKTNLPTNYWELESWYSKLKIPRDLIEELSISKYSNLFAKCVSEMKINPTLAAVVLIQYPKRLKKQNLNINVLDEKMFEGILECYKDGLISKDGIFSILIRSIKKGKFYPELLPEPITQERLIKIVETEKKNIDLPKLQLDLDYRMSIMGKLMNKLRISVDGSLLHKMLTNLS